jgi:DNA-binding response OmpR family regulator
MAKVLIVDDDHAILEAMQIAIEDEGYDVMTVADGNSAAAKAKEFLPHIILLDLLLSGKDGTEIIGLLREQPETKGIPVILLSAHPTAAETAKKCGATDFLAKPFDVDELLDKVATHIRQDNSEKGKAKSEK